jgi:uncharacterized membrane protein
MSQREDRIPSEEAKPLLADVIVRNITNLSRLRQQTAQRRTLQEHLADAITSVSGRMLFVYLHILWFGSWIVINAGWQRFPAFDPFPYGLLTMIVSLEAIFLSTFVLISQNRLSDEAERRADLHLHIGLLTEHEVTRVLQMLDAIQDKLEIVNHTQSELAQLEIETKPEDVLAEIQRLHDRVLQRHADIQLDTAGS